MEELVRESVDDTFVQDFLLTYRTFLKTPLPIIEKLKTVWTSEDLNRRERVRPLVITVAREYVCMYVHTKYLF